MIFHLITHCYDLLSVITMAYQVRNLDQFLKFLLTGFQLSEFDCKSRIHSHLNLDHVQPHALKEEYDSSGTTAEGILDPFHNKVLQSTANHTQSTDKLGY